MVSTAPNPSPPEVLLFDTNLLIIYAREGTPSQLLEDQLGLQAGRVHGNDCAFALFGL